MSAEENKALSRRLFQEFWDQKNLAVADELLAANHVDHTPGSPPGLPHGPEGIKQFAWSTSRLSPTYVSRLMTRSPKGTRW